MLLEFERPKNQSEENQNRRAKACQMYYDKFAGSSNTTSDPVSHDFKPYIVRITVDVLNYRQGPGTQYPVNGVITSRGLFTIVEERDGWGRLKSGAGWICLEYTKLYKVL